jgi:fimbrial chaperone protein
MLSQQDKTMIVHQSFRSLFTFLLAFLAVCGWAHTAHADLTITPVRVVFEGRDRSATIELINTTRTTNTYRMKWMDMKMGPSGRYELLPADETDPNSVSKMVIFSPRQVTIEPNGHQTVRLSLRRPADLPPGEYRSHLGMVRLAKQGPEKPDDNAKGIEMEMRINLGFSIPVIVRSGEDPDLKISLNNPKLGMSKDEKNPAPELTIDLRRDAGKFSTNGTLVVYWTPANGQEKPIGGLNNLTLYPELQTRTVHIPLKEAPSNGSVRVEYVGKFEIDGKKLAEKTFPIGK